MRPTLQLAIDCHHPPTLLAFWATALGYVVEPPPEGAPTWNAYWRGKGFGDEDLDPDGDGSSSLVDPDGVGPRLFFQPVPEAKTLKNRLHLDLLVGGGRSVPLADRRVRVDAEVERLVAAGATRVRPVSEEGVDHYAIAMLDPEGNEFDVV